MKTNYVLLAGFFILCYSQTFSQTSENFDPVRAELSVWDQVRGPWLASSLEAMAKKEPVPTRTFPENFTPYQMLKMVPKDTRGNIASYAKDSKARGENNVFWSDIERYVTAVDCGTSSGRSYGDPHLSSFDGAKYSFQTVGEFVLTKSNSGNMEVQTRQKPQKEDFSLNTAVAMNVAGDRIAIYASDYPDADYSTPVRLNGQPLNLNGSTYFLEHGGTIKKTNDSYTIYWPSGESVIADSRRSGGMEFMNVSVHILSCSKGDYSGLMGNANGMSGDDFNSIGVSPPRTIVNDPFGDNTYRNKQHQVFITKQFAESHRIVQANSLFDYAMGRTTETFTDRSFPRVIYSIDDLDQRRIDRSRKYCERNGIAAGDMNGCIYDNAFLNLDASQASVVQDPTQGTVLRPITNPVANTNSTRPNPTRPNSIEAIQGKDSPNSGASRVEEKPSSPDKPTSVNETKETVPATKPVEKPVFKPTPKPVVKPSVPKPVAPKPIKPKPVTPKPVTPKPSGKGVIKTGKGL